MMTAIELILGFIFLILLVFFIFVRAKEKKEETFEKRKW
jgi:hypothetical protein